GLLNEAALAKPGLADQEHDLPAPLKHLADDRAQPGPLGITPDERRAPPLAAAHQPDVRPAPQHAVHGDRRALPLDLDRAKRLDLEQPRHTPVGGFGDLHRARRSGLLDARRDVDRKSTRLNSSHVKISYAVFCLKKKTNTCKYSQ